MIFIFYESSTDKIYICSETEPTKVINLTDQNIMDHIPNDDILYVQNAHLITRAQFKQWLAGNWEFQSKAGPESSSVDLPVGDSEPTGNKLYIHPTRNGTILIHDIAEFPDGIQLNGKWHFMPVNQIGYETLKESRHFQVLKKQGKIEIVDEQYFRANKHRQAKKKSPAQDALDSILVPSDIKALAAADGEWRSSDSDGPIEIDVEP